MAMMAKMRSLAPAFIISVGVLFVLFMVLSDSNVMEVFGVRTNVLGSVNGVKITYQEFMKTMDTERENQKQQTGKDIPDSQTDQFRDQVWDAMVSKILIDQQINKFGISVSDQEIKDILLSNNPPAFLKRQFIDSTGKFNRQMYLSAIYNPKNSQALIQAEDYLRQNQLNQKLQSMLLASVTVSPEEVKREFVDQNTKINSQYVLVGLNEYPESSIKVTDNELRNYYNNHLDDYQVLAKRKIDYVLFPLTPSSDDTVNVKRDLESVMDQLKNDTASFKSLAQSYSSKPFAKDTLNITQISAAADSVLMNGKAGSVVGPVLSKEGYVIYRLVSKVRSKNTYVRASHILINQFGSDEKNLQEATKLYEELRKGADFAKLAEKYSRDPGSAVKGGDLGWFGKGQMVPAFEQACFTGRVGVVQKPVKTNFGYHIIKVTGRTSDEFVVERIIEPILTSATTKDLRLNNAKDFSYIANKDGFEKEAKLMNYKVISTPAFTKSYNYVPTLGVDKNLVDFSFNNDQNSISDAIKTSKGYVVAKITSVMPETVEPFDKVKASIKPKIVKEKQYEKAEKQASLIKSKIGEDLSKAVSIDPKAIVNQTGQFKPDQIVPTVGRDFNFIANSLRTPVGKVTGPVKGQKGYYLIKVLSRTPFDSSAFDVQRNKIMANIINQKKNSFFSEWMAKLKKNADIVDHRNQFFAE